MLNLTVSTKHSERNRNRWAAIDGLFSPHDAAELAATFLAHFKRLSHYAAIRFGEKYTARALIGRGERRNGIIPGGDCLSSALGLRAGANDFLSPAYRKAIRLNWESFECNAPKLMFLAIPGGLLGTARDPARQNRQTPVLYFNRSWNDEDGGCLDIAFLEPPKSLRRFRRSLATPQ